MPSQRIILGIGLAILLLIGAASIGLDVKSRHDAAAVEHTIGVLRKISDVRLLLRGAESAARGFGLSGSDAFLNEYRTTSGAMVPAIDDLIASTRDSPDQVRLLEEAKPLVVRRIDIFGDMIKFRTADDSAAVAALIARGEGRAVTREINAKLDQVAANERGLLSVREANSTFNGRLLLAIDLAGVALILLLATLLTLETRRARRELQDSLSVTRAANESLEAAVAERTEHLRRRP